MQGERERGNERERERERGREGERNRVHECMYVANNKLMQGENVGPMLCLRYRPARET